MRRKPRIIKILEDADDICKILTGRRLSYLLARAVEVFGGEYMKPPVRPEREDDPYYVLGIRKDASDVVVKAAYRALTKKYHPDFGESPNQEMMARINEAFEKISKERGWK